VFVYADRDGADLICDFDALDPAEVIDLSGVTGLSDVADVLARATQHGDDVRILFGHGDSLRLRDVDLAHLDASDFVI
jgi:hypothetical protein